MKIGTGPDILISAYREKRRFTCDIYISSDAFREVSKRKESVSKKEEKCLRSVRQVQPQGRLRIASAGSAD